MDQNHVLFNLPGYVLDTCQNFTTQHFQHRILQCKVLNSGQNLHMREFQTKEILSTSMSL